MKYEVAIPYLIRSLSPLHPGSGARVSGVVDLPVQREAHTGFPVIYGSSIKGVLRTWASRKISSGSGEKQRRNTSDNGGAGGGNEDPEELIKKIFGPEPGSGSEHMGRAIFTDAKLLFFPVKSLRGIFAWVTSPFLLNRFKRDMDVLKELTSSPSISPELKNLVKLEKVKVPSVGSAIIPSQPRDSEIVVEGNVILEDVGLKATKMEKDAELDLDFLKAFSENLPSDIGGRLAIVHDEMFRHLLTRGMLITPHIRIDPKTGTVSRGGLWYQEDLPPQTILYSAVITENALKTSVCSILRGYAQLGGDATTGLGIVEIIPDRGSCPAQAGRGGK